MGAAEQVTRVGVISDTHGHVDPRVHEAFRGVDCIVHAGDVTTPDVLLELETIAPIVALAQGNCDPLGLTPNPRAQAKTTVAGVRILVIHDFSDLGEIPPKIDVVVCGHSHQPRAERHGRVLVVNPGSASQRRKMPSRSVGVLEIAEDASVEFRLLSLDEFGPAPS